MDYDDSEYYHNDDYYYTDYSYDEEQSPIARRQGELSEEEKILELAGNGKFKKEKVSKSGNNNRFLQKTSIVLTQVQLTRSLS